MPDIRVEVELAHRAAVVKYPGGSHAAPVWVRVPAADLLELIDGLITAAAALGIPYAAPWVQVIEPHNDDDLDALPY